MEIKIAPSILAADFCRLGEEIISIQKGGAALIHVDVMDGHFVPNISVGIPVVQSLHTAAILPLDVHLMIDRPSRYAQAFVDAGADLLNMHAEADTPEALIKTLRYVRQKGKKTALTIKPGTAVGTLEPYLPFLDMVLLMTVEPGFGGQGFLPGSLDRIAEARRLINLKNPACDLEVDGGIVLDNARACVNAGANVLVAGSSVFRAREGAETAVRRLREEAQGA